MGTICDYRARYYDPANGRFATEDPVHFGGYDNDFYRYVGNNPAKFNDPAGLVSIDPSFRKDCLENLKRALTLLKAFAAPKCNSCFKKIGDKRSLTEILDDDRIKIHSEQRDRLTDDGGIEMGFMFPGDKLNIHLRPVTCRLGRWQLAQTLAHELTHQTLTPALGQEGIAGQMEINCGFEIRIKPESVTVVAQ